jgi:hypothetical protein
LPQGVSGAIKRRGGTGPFMEVRKHGPIPFGGAVLTSAGRLPFKGIIHVAGINMLWRVSEQSIRESVKNAVWLAHEKGCKSITGSLVDPARRFLELLQSSRKGRPVQPRFQPEWVARTLAVKTFKEVARGPLMRSQP